MAASMASSWGRSIRETVLETVASYHQQQPHLHQQRALPWWYKLPNIIFVDIMNMVCGCVDKTFSDRYASH
ncbi:hypothetical protein ZEAMMB73_Zm00001d002900 [Zea mays]|uniref:Uncharacterized protein n=1 Tax=Zea mays TaxID=4577 RepID=A0A1D6E532_MAIZE|nr:hypothetical protein ZEAMMB73_Zm00001d002900 [Zea mays]